MHDHADLIMLGRYDSQRPGRRRGPPEDGLNASGDSLSCAEGSTCPQWAQPGPTNQVPLDSTQKPALRLQIGPVAPGGVDPTIMRW